MLLKTHWGKAQLKDFAIQQIQNELNGTLKIEHLDGDVWSGLNLKNVQLFQQNKLVAQIPKVELNYQLEALLHNQLTLHDIVLYKPYFQVWQLPDSSWNVAHLLKVKPEKAPSQNALQIALRQAKIYNATGKATFLNHKTLTLHKLDATLNNFFVQGDTYHGQLNKVWASLKYSDRKDTIQLSTDTYFAHDFLKVDKLNLSSQFSNVSAKGKISFPLLKTPNYTAFTLQTKPFAFKEVAPFLSYLNPNETLDLSLHVAAPTPNIQFKGKGKFKTGASFNLVGDMSPYKKDQPLFYKVKGDVRELNLAYLTLNPALSSRLNGFINVDAQGISPKDLAGTALLNLQPSWFQDQKIEALNLEGEIQNGLLDYHVFGKVNQAMLNAKGWVRPFDKEISYFASGNAKEVLVNAFIPVKGLKAAPVSGTFNLRGNGFKTLPQGDFEVETAHFSYQEPQYNLDLNLINPVIRGNILGNQMVVDGTVNGASYRPNPTADWAKVENALFTATYENGDAVFEVKSEKAQYRDDIFLHKVNVNGDWKNKIATFVFDAQNAKYAQNINIQNLNGTGNWQDGRGIFKANAQEGRVVKLGVENLPLNNIAVNFDWQNQEGAFNFVTQLPQEGNITGSGKINPLTQELSLSHTKFRNFNPQYVLSTLEKGRISGALEAFRSTGFLPQQMLLSGNVSIENSTYGTFQIQQGKLDFSLNKGKLSYVMQSLIENADLYAQGALYPFESIPHYVVEEGRFSNLNPQKFYLEGDFTGNLNGDFSLDLRGKDFTKLDGETQITLNDSAFNQYQIQSGNGRILLNNGQLNFDIAAQTPNGGIKIEGDAHPFLAVPNYRIKNGVLRNFNLAKWFNNPDLESNLNGEFKEAQVSFKDMKQFVAQLRLDLAPSRFKKMEINEGNIRLNATPENIDLSANFLVDKGAFKLQAAGKIRDNQPDYRFEGQFTHLNIAGLTDSLAFTDLNLDFKGTGWGIDPQTMQLQTQLIGAKSKIDQIVIDSLRTNVQLDNGVANFLDTQILSNILGLTGNGKIVFGDFNAEESDFSFVAKIKNLSALTQYIGINNLDAEGTLKGRILGTTDDFRMLIETADEGLSLIEYDDIHIGNATGNVVAEYVEKQWNLEGKLRTQNLSVPGYVLRNADFRTAYRDSILTLDGGFVLDERLKGNLQVDYDNHQNRTRIGLKALNFTLLTDEWRLEKPVDIFQSAQGMQINNLQLKTDNQQEIWLDGNLSADQNQQIRASAKNVRIDGITNLLRFNGLNGTLTGSLDLSGTLQKPTFVADIKVPDVSKNTEILGSAKMDLFYANESMRINGGIVPTVGDTLSIAGILPLHLNLDFAKPRPKVVSQSQGNLQIQSDAFPLKWLNPFFDANTLDKLNGLAQININLAGNLNTPQVTGNILANNIALTLPFNGTRYQNGSLEGEFIGDKIKINAFSLETPNKGKVRAHGTIALATIDKAKLDLNLNAQNFELIDTEIFRGRATGKAHLSGTLFKPILRSESEILLDEFSVYLNSELMVSATENIALSEKDLRRIEADFGRQAAMSDTTTVSFYNATDIDLRIRSNGNTWLRSKFNPRMDILLTGSLEIKKPYKGLEEVKGSLSCVKDRSKIVFGRTFDLQSGTLRFNGDMFNPVFEDFVAQYKGRSRQQTESQIVELNLKGDLTNPDFQFTAEPAMDEVQILAYLANGGASGEQIATDFLAQYGSSLLESIASDQLPLDLLEIRIDEKTSAPALKIGKYIARKWFVSAQSIIGKDSNNLRFFVDYQRKQWLLYQLDYGSSTTTSTTDATTSSGAKLGFFVLMEYVY